MNILDPNYHLKSFWKDAGRYVAGILLFIGLLIIVFLLCIYLGMIAGYENMNSSTMSNYSSQVYKPEFHDHRIDPWS